MDDQDYAIDLEIGYEAPDVAPDAHLEMDFEDRMSGSYTDDPHGYEDWL